MTDRKVGRDWNCRVRDEKLHKDIIWLHAWETVVARYKRTSASIPLHNSTSSYTVTVREERYILKRSYYVRNTAIIHRKRKRNEEDRKK